MDMKILALSDQVVEQLYSPSIKERFGDVSLVVGCGDLAIDYGNETIAVNGRSLKQGVLMARFLLHSGSDVAI